MSRNISPQRALTGLAVTATLTAALTTSLLPATTATAAPVEQERVAATKDKDSAKPLVFAHRGASGYRPEHTLAAYELAIKMGADYIEPDLVSTKDGVLVARHENEISGTTDVADHPEFAERRTTKTIDGVEYTGWFTEDFTLAELKTLRAKERLPEVRPDNTRYDGRYEVPTLAEVLRFVDRWEKRTGRVIGVAVETKHPTYFDSIDLSLEEPLVRTLKQFKLNNGKQVKGRSPFVAQSFEVGNLQDLDHLTDVPLVQLTDASGGPADLAEAGTTYADLHTRKGLRGVARYADWLAPAKDVVLPRDASGAVSEPSAVVSDAHRVGLEVVIWTLRDENQFMATNFRRGTDPNAKGDGFAEATAFLDAGVDAIFSDHPDTALDARDVWWKAHR